MPRAVSFVICSFDTTHLPSRVTTMIKIKIAFCSGQVHILIEYRSWCCYVFQRLPSFYKQQFFSTSRSHSLHFTKQHQQNLQSHLSRTVSVFVSKPRPQQSVSQPSSVVVLLQGRPLVPGCSQKSGLDSKYTKSVSEWCLSWVPTGTSRRPPGLTSAALSNRSLRRLPTNRNRGRALQQVFVSQEPDTPWHLQSTLMLYSTI